MEKRPNDEVLLDNLGKIAYTLDRTYMKTLEKDYGVLYFNEKYNQNNVVSYSDNIRAIKVDKWLFDKEQEPGECFKNVLSTFSDGDHTVALVVKRTPTNTEMYFVVKNEGKGRNDETRDNVDLLEAAIKGNFPGTHMKQIIDPDLIAKLFSNEEKIKVDNNEVEQFNSISLFANTPSKYSEKYITQGLDKLLNGIVPKDETKSYTVIFLAESVSQNDVKDIISGYEEMASAIYPFSQYQFQMGSNEVETTGEMSSISNGTSTTDSIFKTHSVNIGLNGGRNESNTKGVTRDRREAVKLGFTGVGTVAGAIIGGVGGFFVGGPAGVVACAGGGAKVGSKLGRAAGDIGAAFKDVQNESKTEGGNVGASFGYGYSWGTSKAITNSKNYMKGKNHSIALGKSESTTYTYKSYMISDLLERLEDTIERINKSQATGLWKYSTYVLAYDSTTSKSVANYLKGITEGKESYLEPSVVQEWSREPEKNCAFSEIKKYVSMFCHPIFGTIDNESKNELKDLMMLTATSYVGTDELSNVITFPKKSLSGIPVVEGVTFGREPYSLDTLKEDLYIGNAYHLHEKTDTKINLSIEELSKHTFITGSTGSGKSNTVYWMLEKLIDARMKFLVIEPAKGEYKLMIGQNDTVFVYGTNPLRKDCKLLRINPFSFPTEEVHILEHLDRLVEIFNVCWPMYAAMPAILKESMERAYIAAGWDLVTSEHKYGELLFPTFDDVMVQVKRVLNESDYSSDNKGDYTGALVTRIKSLTNGINRLIFSSDEISGEELFENNVIVDLSRVGSTETKSLIMGLLILKLQEYRMKNNKPNTPLNHVTVIEEAHNILRRTSTEQFSEGSNLLGKSVEMLSNAIAEMRTYGEGFIIVDQSPNLLDMSVIRNTNTKIIMRLPDYEDRLLVGKAAGLNDAQIEEVSRFEMGVASINQSGWIEPVLCKIPDFEKESNILKKHSNKEKEYDNIIAQNKEADQQLLELLVTKEIYRKCDRNDIEKIKKIIISSGLSATIKCEFLDYIMEDEESVWEKQRCLIYDFFGAEKAFDKSKSLKNNLDEWIAGIISELTPSIEKYDKQTIDLLVSLIMYEHAQRTINDRVAVGKYTEEYLKNGRVV